MKELVKGYCDYEKVAGREITGATRIKLQNGTPVIKGICANCGKPIFAPPPKEYHLTIRLKDWPFPMVIKPTKHKKVNEKPREILTQLTSYVLAKDWVRVLSLLEKNFDKNSEMDWYDKGNALSQLNRADEALKCYAKAVAIDPLYSKAWYRKGYVHFYRREYSHAFNSFAFCMNAEEEKERVGKIVDHPWKLAAAFSATLTLLAERDQSTWDQLVNLLSFVYTILLDENIITKEAMPITSIPDGRFADFLMLNRKEIFRKLQPDVAPMQLWVGDAGLPGHH
jgi:tetratricopeptide (TPR) repeat protein